MPKSRIQFTLLLVAAFAGSACKHDSSNFCEGAPHNNCLAIDAPLEGACTDNAQCSGATAVCDVAGSMTCVQCTPTAAQACLAMTPVCASDNACHACTAHSQCASNACLPDGSCGDDVKVAYVDPGGTDNALCTKAMPCTKVAKALATNRDFVKFTGTTNEQVTLNNRNVTFLATPGAKLTDTSNGILLRIDGTSRVNVYDLEISGASGVSNPGVSLQAGNAATVTLTRVKLLNNAGGGITASGGSLTVSQSTLANNAGGGISVSGAGATFVIVGNVLFNNGTQLGSVGGVAISASQNAANRLEFNSFNKNQAQDTLGCAIHCVAGAFTARNNIMSGNATATNMEQIGGSCSHAFSIARPGTLPGGTGNSAVDPLFVNTTTGDLHLMPTSPARGAADPTANVGGVAAFDIDGDPRTNPADIGADEVP